MNISSKILCGFIFLWFAGISSLPAANPAREDKLINNLQSTNLYDVTHSLAVLEKEYPNSQKALPAIKSLLKDQRRAVRCKAARVLGAIHADVNEEDIRAICALLKSRDQYEVEDGLKSLRGLKAHGAVPDILPVLKSDNDHNVRDACRTLAVLAGKDAIPAIEPLLDNPDPAVQADAYMAIKTLREKP